jgi:tRNA pseudouridine(38-40) synthase
MEDDSNNDTDDRDHNGKQDGNSSKKRNKQQEKRDGRRRRDWGEKMSGQEIAGGSYATESLRTLLGIELPALDDDEAKLPSKKKVALLIGYLGTNYAGFQMNAEQRTVQAELELALVKSKMLAMCNFGVPFKYSWSTSGRTDKGVHACAQVCGAKLHVGEESLDDIRERINQCLPSDIRVLHVVRTTRTFCAKTMRLHVRYQYMIPSYCLHPNLRQLFVDNNITWNTSLDASNPLSADEANTMKSILKDYRVSQEQLGRLRQALKMLEGTHSFHNFTKNVKSDEGRASRYIVSYEHEEPVVIDGVEWIPTRVLGQSFLVYQVRKMTSLLIDVARGIAPASVVEAAFAKDSDIRLNVAPAQGLFKEMSYYSGYNERKAQTNRELDDLEWDKPNSAVRERWLAFKTEQVMKCIVKEEETQANFVKYMFNQEFIFELEKHYKLNEEK